nr:unnamed protein product [Callosobruchus analis]
MATASTTAAALCLTPTNSRPSTPNNSSTSSSTHYHAAAAAAARHHMANQTNNGYGLLPHQLLAQSHHISPGHNHTLLHKDPMNCQQLDLRQVHTLKSSHHILRDHDKDMYKSTEEKWNSSNSTVGSHSSSQGIVVQTIQTENNNVAKFAAPHSLDNLQISQSNSRDGKDLPTPNSTPTTSRKSRRRSNLFAPSKKGDEKSKNGCGGDWGSGRAIPLKQGYLYKRSSKPLNKEWKKKYVTLCDDGRLTYHPSLHDYMDDVHGKEVGLQYVTVKVPGKRPRGTKAIITVAGTGAGGGNSHGAAAAAINEGLGGLSITGKDKRATEKVLLSAFETVKDPSSKYCQQQSSDEGMVLSSSNSFLNGEIAKTETPHVKKRHRRVKSSGVKNSEYDDNDGYEFIIVSLDTKQWHFEASSCEERDEWVSAIEQQILNSLQLNESAKQKANPADASTIQQIKARVPGNGCCVDYPDWASLNLGVLMPGNLAVMLAIGNSLANSVWECQTQNRAKPTPTSSREEKERWIRAKYENKEFLPPPNNTMLLGQQLIDAVCASNVKGIVNVLARANAQEINTTVGTRDLRTPLHLACAMGNLAVAQLLIWHNADVKCVDQDGRTCLAYAKAALSIATAKSQPEASISQCRALVELLLSYGCPETATTVSISGTIPRRRGSNSGVQQATPSGLPTQQSAGQQGGGV